MVFFFSSRRRHTRLVSDWSSDVCSSDLKLPAQAVYVDQCLRLGGQLAKAVHDFFQQVIDLLGFLGAGQFFIEGQAQVHVAAIVVGQQRRGVQVDLGRRSEEHTSELQSLTNLVCRLLLEKKKKTKTQTKECENQ